jgi:hypothetical protein
MRSWTMLVVLTGLLAVSEVQAAGPPGNNAGQPVLSDDGRWVVSWVLIPVGGLFVAAIAVGIVARLESVDDLPPSHSHDEPPGASHHPHGHGGH